MIAGNLEVVLISFLLGCFPMYKSVSPKANGVSYAAAGPISVAELNRYIGQTSSCIWNVFLGLQRGGNHAGWIDHATSSWLEAICLSGSPGCTCLCWACFWTATSIGTAHALSLQVINYGIQSAWKFSSASGFSKLRLGGRWGTTLLGDRPGCIMPIWQVLLQAVSTYKGLGSYKDCPIHGQIRQAGRNLVAILLQGFLQAKTSLWLGRSFCNAASYQVQLTERFVRLVQKASS